MEDDRSSLIVIAAGYKNDMSQFVASNPGLQSRFTRYLNFEDYNPEELTSIFMNLCAHNQYVTAPEIRERLFSFFETVFNNRDSHFGNGRLVRNIFERTIAVQANRITAQPAASDQELMTINLDDIEQVLPFFTPDKPDKPDNRKPIGY